MSLPWFCFFSALIISLPSLLNTNPFLDDEGLDTSAGEESSRGTFKKRQAPSLPERNLQEKCSDHSFRKKSKAPHEETNQHFQCKDPSKRQAPQPPARVMITNQDAFREDPSPGEGRTSEVGNDLYNKDVETNPFTCDLPTSAKTIKGPAPKPEATRSRPSIGIINHDHGITYTINPTYKKLQMDLADGTINSENPLEKVLYSVNPEAPCNVDQDLHLMNPAGLRKTQAPVPPVKPRRTEEPDLMEQHLPLQLHSSKSEHDQISENQDTKQDHKFKTLSSMASSSILAPLSEEPQELKSSASISVDVGSGSRFRSLQGVNGTSRVSPASVIR